MKSLFKRIFALVLCLMLLLPIALAEDCFTLDVDMLDLDRLSSDDYIHRALSSCAQGIRIRKQISQSSEVAASVRLTLTQMDTQSLVFDKNYGYQSGTFDSGILYLPYVGDSTTPYLITLYAGDYVYALPFMHQQRRMHQNSACTAGVRLCDLEPAQGSDWLMGTMVDLNELRLSGSMTVEICASNSYVIGSAEISLYGGELGVQLSFLPAANVQLENADLYVVTGSGTLSNAKVVDIHERVNVKNADHALVYVPMQLSYDPADLDSFCLDQAEASRQQLLWNEAHGVSFSYSQPADSAAPSSGWDDGWSSGWDDGWDDGWSSGW